MSSANADQPQIQLVSPEDFSARLALYKRELWRRGVVMFGMIFLPLILLAAAVLIGGGFFPLFAQGLIAFCVTFWLLLLVGLIFFYRLARYVLPAKIGLLCPKCNGFLLDIDIEQFVKTGVCSRCQTPLLEIRRSAKSGRLSVIRRQDAEG